MAKRTKNKPAESPDPSLPTDDAKAMQYDRHKLYVAEKRRAMSRAGRDIGDCPAVKDPARRAKAVASLRVFCDTYWPDVFNLAWSDDHLRVIRKIEETIARGGKFAMAMPRGSGKTTIAGEAAPLWAVVTGQRRFVVLVAADGELAEQALGNLKTMVEASDAFAEDFPEVWWPVSRLDGIAQRAAGQVCQGEPTNLEWASERVAFPTVKGSLASGAIVLVKGLTGRLRGMKYTRPDGTSVRPDLVLIDDPQTDESANSPSQCTLRERFLMGAVLGMKGPKQTIAAFMPCTVIRPGDLSDRMLSHDLHPDWHGERIPFVRRWPDAEALWLRYGEMRRASQRSGGHGEDATAFYLENRSAMDAGSEVMWAERFDPPLEHSAIQHAWNERIDRGDAAFWAEYQNSPIVEKAERHEGLREEEVVERAVNLPRGAVPLSAAHLTAFVDVQKRCLYWLVAAWAEDFTGHVVDYGAWPDQGVPWFLYRDLKESFASKYHGLSVEASIFAALRDLTGSLLGKEFNREGGGVVRVGRVLVDSAWGEHQETVFDFCRRSGHGGALMPSRGWGISAKKQPMDEWARKPGDRVGDHWRIPSDTKGKAIRHCLIDVNHWKGFVSRRLRTPHGERGALTLFDGGADIHRMLAEHLASERPVSVTANGRTVEEWSPVGPGRDNHLLDCLAGAAVAGSILGARLPLPGGDAAEPAPRKRMKFSEMQRMKRENRA